MGLLVERLARVGAKRSGDAQHLVFDERVAGRVPGGVAAGLEGGAQTAAGEGGGVRLALDELLARKGHDGAAVVLRVDERIVLLGGDAGERLEPVRVVRGAVFDAHSFIAWATTLATSRSSGRSSLMVLVGSCRWLMGAALA